MVQTLTNDVDKFAVILLLVKEIIFPTIMAILFFILFVALFYWLYTKVWRS